MVKININIKKKDLWLLSAIMVFLIGVGYVVAFGGNQPSVMGHNFGELELPSCSDGQVLKKISGTWQCGSFWTHSGASVFGPGVAPNYFAGPPQWADLDLSSIVGANYALVLLRVCNTGGLGGMFAFRPNGDTNDYFFEQYVDPNFNPGPAVNRVITGATSGQCNMVLVETGPDGKLEWTSGGAIPGTRVYLQGYVKG